MDESLLSRKMWLCPPVAPPAGPAIADRCRHSFSAAGEFPMDKAAIVSIFICGHVNSTPFIRIDPMPIQIESIAVSTKKGTRKRVVQSAQLVENHGIEGDAHAGDWHRQVSFLAAESIDTARRRGLDVTFGDFAENVATTGIQWASVPVGSRFRLGETAEVEITQIGKECVHKCAIYYKAGDCIMPREGVFARVVRGGTIHTGDRVEPIRPADVP
jgi:MOSC domain-containing protein YiiM